MNSLNKERISQEVCLLQSFVSINGITSAYTVGYGTVLCRRRQSGRELNGLPTSPAASFVISIYRFIYRFYSF